MDSWQIATEKQNEKTKDIDKLPILEIIKQMNEEDKTVPAAVEKALPQIAVVVDHIVQSLQQGGRLIYVGAGTSGRLGVLDASECPPTFGTPPEQVLAIIAGGEKALRFAVEGAEDDEQQSKQDGKRWHITSNDMVIGIAASGRTPYTRAALEYAKSVGAKVACIVNTPYSDMEKVVDYPIVISTGPEVITGSTRLKAGTAQKLVLNMLTTAAMIKMGKVYSNWMVDLQPTNKKLMRRAIHIITQITGVTEEEAQGALHQHGSIKAAILALSADEVSHTHKKSPEPL
jgi:N-acetylmuramic acid 6-phosphate etherase